MIDWNAKKAPAWFEHNVAKHYPLPRLSDADMIQMVTDIEEVRDLMSLRSYYQAADLRQKELDELSGIPAAPCRKGVLRLQLWLLLWKVRSPALVCG